MARMSAVWKLLAIASMLLVTIIAEGGDSFRGPDCIDGSKWRNLCNGCLCNNGIARCTQKRCWNGFTSNRNSPECEGPSEWKKYGYQNDCYWCVCKDRIGICNKISC